MSDTSETSAVLDQAVAVKSAIGHWIDVTAANIVVSRIAVQQGEIASKYWEDAAHRLKAELGVIQQDLILAEDCYEELLSESVTSMEVAEGRIERLRIYTEELESAVRKAHPILGDDYIESLRNGYLARNDLN